MERDCKGVDNKYLQAHYPLMNYDRALKEWDDRRAVMAKLRRQNVSVRDIATQYGISTQRCYQILKVNNEKIDPKKTSSSSKSLKK